MFSPSFDICWFWGCARCISRQGRHGKTGGGKGGGYIAEQNIHMRRNVVAHANGGCFLLAFDSLFFLLCGMYCTIRARGSVFDCGGLFGYSFALFSMFELLVALHDGCIFMLCVCGFVSILRGVGLQLSFVGDIEHGRYHMEFGVSGASWEGQGNIKMDWDGLRSEYTWMDGQEFSILIIIRLFRTHFF